MHRRETVGCRRPVRCPKEPVLSVSRMDFNVDVARRSERITHLIDFQRLGKILSADRTERVAVHIEC